MCYLATRLLIGSKVVPGGLILRVTRYTGATYRDGTGLTQAVYPPDGLLLQRQVEQLEGTNKSTTRWDELLQAGTHRMAGGSARLPDYLLCWRGRDTVPHIAP